MTIETEKVNITFLRRQKERILEIIQDEGLVDIVEKEDVEGAAEEELDRLEYKAAQAQSAIKFLERKESKNGGILASLIPEKIQVGKKEFKNIDQNLEGEKLSKEALDLEETLNKIESKLDKAREELEDLKKWKKLTLTEKQCESLKRTKIIFGKLPQVKLEEMLVEVKKASKDIAIFKGGQDQRMVYMAFVFPKNIEKELQKVLSRAGLEEGQPDFEKSPYRKYREKRKQLRGLEEEKEKIEARINEFTGYKDKLKVYHDWLRTQLRRKKTEKYLLETDRVVTITGWVREDEIEKLEKTLTGYTKEVALTRVKKKEEESAPVVLKNRGTFKYYEMITKLYGMPRGTEPDPTVYLAPFFTAFFAVAITDAGYGIIMMLLSVFLLRFTDLPGKRIFKILFWAGVFTLVIGAFFGGWFGVSAPDLPASLGIVKASLVKIMWMNPVQNPVKMLIFTFVLGIFQIIAGIGVAAWWDIKQGRVKEGLMDHASWYLILAAIFGWIAAKSGYLSVAPQIATYVLVGATVVFLYCQGRGQENPIKRMLVGTGSLYDLLGYVSDVLSYSRLLALGLATAIIAMVVNLIAGIFMDMISIPVLDWALVGLILIVGHSFNLAVNSLSGFIHSARLQFVEFFPKFMKGGGRRFEPLKNEGEYVEIIDN